MESSSDQSEARLTEMTQLVVSDPTVDATLNRIASTALMIPSCDGCGVSVVDGDHVSTRAASGARADRIDAIQYDAGDGPCLQAIMDGRAVTVDTFESEHRWPDFTPSARAEGLRASHSVPLFVDEEVVGSINFYSYDEPFAPDDQILGELFAVQAAIAVENARTVDRLRTVVNQLNEALSSRDVIGQAKGILMLRHGLDADRAFDQLRRRSQRDNTKLRDVAAAIVVEAGGARRPVDGE